MEIKVIGFDPSLSNWGAALCRVNVDTLEVTVENLVLTETESEKKKGVNKQSDDLRRAGEVRKTMELLCFDRALAITEVPFYSPTAYPQANFNAGIVIGVLSSCPIPLIQVSPQEVKMAAVGHRQAAKEEMIEWGMLKHPNAPWKMRTLKGKQYPTAANEHLADALAAIYAGIQTQQFKQALAMYRSMTATS